MNTDHKPDTFTLSPFTFHVLSIFQLKYESELRQLRKEVHDRNNKIDEKEEEMYTLQEQVESNQETITQMQTQIDELTNRQTETDPRVKVRELKLRNGKEI